MKNFYFWHKLMNKIWGSKWLEIKKQTAEKNANKFIEEEAKLYYYKRVKAYLSQN